MGRVQGVKNKQNQSTHVLVWVVWVMTFNAFLDWLL